MQGRVETGTQLVSTYWVSRTHPAPMPEDNSGELHSIWTCSATQPAFRTSALVLRLAERASVPIAFCFRSHQRYVKIRSRVFFSPGKESRRDYYHHNRSIHSLG